MLKELDLFYCLPHDKHLFISDCLKINRTLQELYLCGNNITDEGAKKLAEAIQMNTVLQELHLSENWMSTDSESLYDK